VRNHPSPSGTRVRERLERVEVPPPEDSRSEVAAILLPWATPNLDSFVWVGHS